MIAPEHQTTFRFELFFQLDKKGSTMEF